jgi:hypothetical protein
VEDCLYVRYRQMTILTALLVPLCFDGCSGRRPEPENSTRTETTKSEEQSRTKRTRPGLDRAKTRSDAEETPVISSAASTSAPAQSVTTVSSATLSAISSTPEPLVLNEKGGTTDAFRKLEIDLPEGDLITAFQLHPEKLEQVRARIDQVYDDFEKARPLDDEEKRVMDRYVKILHRELYAAVDSPDDPTTKARRFRAIITRAQKKLRAASPTEQ